MSADEIRQRTQATWDDFYSLPLIWQRSKGCVKSLKARVMFVMISKLYRQMYANTGIATDSARVARSARRARVLARFARKLFVAEPMPDLEVPLPRSRRGATGYDVGGVEFRRFIRFSEVQNVHADSGRAGGREANGGIMKACISCALCFVAATVVLRDNGPLSRSARGSDGPAVGGLAERVVGATTTVGTSVLGRFLAEYEQSLQTLVSYRAVRRLSVVARGGKMTASLTARTSLDPVNGFQFEVLEESGSGMLRSRVLHGALEAEREAKRREKGAHGALTAANYSFDVGEFTPDGLLRVAIHPVRKDSLLVEGSILLTNEAADLVRMEGLLVKRPSFWTRKVLIVRDYGRIGGVRVPDRDGVDCRHPLCRAVDVLDELRVRIDQRRAGARRGRHPVPTLSVIRAHRTHGHSQSARRCRAARRVVNLEIERSDANARTTAFAPIAGSACRSASNTPRPKITGWPCLP